MLTYTVRKLCRLCVHVNVHSTYIHVGYVYANVHCTHINVGCIYINNNNNKLMGVFYGAHIQPEAAYSALHHNIHGHWTCWFRSCTILIPRGGSIQHCSHVAIVTCRTTIAISVPPCTHLYLSEVEHLKVKYLAHRIAH